MGLAVACMLAMAAVATILTYIGIPSGLGRHVYWLLWSREYKCDVFRSPRKPGEYLHAEWYGDGWGGTPVGDWMGYVVYDPSDSLPTLGTNAPPRKVPGIPCDVVAVRRLEKGWYSVVTDMNQFWDDQHPNC